jgi:hypothetical protein
MYFFFFYKKINSAGSIMWVHHSHNGNLLDDGSAAVTHYEFDSGCCFSAFWHLGHGRCLHGLHEGMLVQAILRFVLRDLTF